MSSEDKTAALLSRLQEFVPFLEDMISNLRSDMPQHSKIVSLHAMILDKRRKFKYETLKRCEEVIVKMQKKTHYKLAPGKFPMKSHILEEETPRSPSPLRPTTTSGHRPIVFPTDTTIRSPDPETWDTKCRNVKHPAEFENDRYVKETPSVYSSAAESIKKPSVFERLGTVMVHDISKPPISVADLELLQCDDEQELEAKSDETTKPEPPVVIKVPSKVSLIPAPIIKPKSHPRTSSDESPKKVDVKRPETKKVEEKTKKSESKKVEEKKLDGKKADEKKLDGKKADEKKSDAKKADEKKSDSKKVDEKKSKSEKPRVEKVVIDPSSIFGNFLSSIDDHIITDKKKTPRRDSKHDEDSSKTPKKSEDKAKKKESSKTESSKKDASKSKESSKSKSSSSKKESTRRDSTTKKSVIESKDKDSVSVSAKISSETVRKSVEHKTKDKSSAINNDAKQSVNSDTKQKVEESSGDITDNLLLTGFYKERIVEVPKDVALETKIVAEIEAAIDKDISKDISYKIIPISVDAPKTEEQKQSMRIADKYNKKPKKKCDEPFNMNIVDQIMQTMKQNVAEKIPFLEESPVSPTVLRPILPPIVHNSESHATPPEVIRRDPRLANKQPPEPRPPLGSLRFSPPPPPPPVPPVHESWMNPFMNPKNMSAMQPNLAAKSFNPFESVDNSYSSNDYDLSVIQPVDFYQPAGSRTPNPYVNECPKTPNAFANDCPMTPNPYMNDCPMTPNPYLTDCPMTPNPYMNDCPMTPNPYMNDGSRTPGPFPNDGSRTPGQFVNDGSRTPGAFVNDGSRTPGQFVNDGSRTPGQFVNDGSRTPGPFVNDGSRTPGAFVNDGSRTPGQFVNDGSRTPGQFVNDGSRTPGQFVNDGSRTPGPFVNDGSRTPGQFINDGSRTPGQFANDSSRTNGFECPKTPNPYMNDGSQTPNPYLNEAPKPVPPPMFHQANMYANMNNYNNAANFQMPGGYQNIRPSLLPNQNALNRNNSPPFSAPFQPMMGRFQQTDCMNQRFSQQENNSTYRSWKEEKAKENLTVGGDGRGRGRGFNSSGFGRGRGEFNQSRGRGDFRGKGRDFNSSYGRGRGNNNINQAGEMDDGKVEVAEVKGSRDPRIGRKDPRIKDQDETSEKPPAKSSNPQKDDEQSSSRVRDDRSSSKPRDERYSRSRSREDDKRSDRSSGRSRDRYSKYDADDSRDLKRSKSHDKKSNYDQMYSKLDRGRSSGPNYKNSFYASRKSAELTKKAIREFKIPKKPRPPSPIPVVVEPPTSPFDKLADNSEMTKETSNKEASKDVPIIVDKALIKQEPGKIVKTEMTEKTVEDMASNEMPPIIPLEPEEVETTMNNNDGPPVLQVETGLEESVVEEKKIVPEKNEMLKFFEDFKEKTKVDDGKIMGMFSMFVDYLKQSEEKSIAATSKIEPEKIITPPITDEVIKDAPTAPVPEVVVDDLQANIEANKKLDDDNAESDNETIKTRKRSKRNVPKKPRRSELDKLHEDIKETLGDDMLATHNKRACTIPKEHTEVVVESPVPPVVVPPPPVVVNDNADEFRQKAKGLKVVLEKLLPPPPQKKTPIGKKQKVLRSAEKSVKTPKIAEKSDVSETADESSSTSSSSPKPKRRAMSRAAKAISTYAEPADLELEVDQAPEEPVPEVLEEPVVEAEEVPKVVTTSKKKRRSNWASGVIKKKKKSTSGEAAVKLKQPESESEPELEPEPEQEDSSLLDEETEAEIDHDYVEPDKNYYLNLSTINDCKLCNFKGKLIVTHYVAAHPTNDVDISRLSPKHSLLALKDAKENKIDAISLPTCDSDTNKYNFKCRFCNYEINNETSATFFDHLTTHTGELRYKCMFCEGRNNTIRNLRSHMSYVHKQTVKTEKIVPIYEAPPNFCMVVGYMCSDCNFLQLNRQKVDSHIQIYHLNDTARTKMINMSLPVEQPFVEAENVNVDVETVEEQAVAVVNSKKRTKASPKAKKVVAEKDSDSEQEVVKVAKKPGPKSKTEVVKKEEIVEEVPAKKYKAGPKSKMVVEKPVVAMEENEDEDLDEDDLPLSKAGCKPGDKTKPVEEPSPVAAVVESEVDGVNLRPKRYRAGPKSKITELNKSFEEEERKDPDRTVFMCDSDMLLEEQDVEEKRLEKMKEIHASIAPAKERTSFLNKLKTRLDTTFAEPIAEVEVREKTPSPTPPPIVLKPVQEPRRSFETVTSPAHVPTTPEPEKLNPISNIVNRLQGRTTPMLPKLQKLEATPICEPDDGTVMLRVSEFMAIVKPDSVPNYVCNMPSCLFNTPMRKVFEMHFAMHHGDYKTLLVCERCPDTQEFVPLETVFKHICFHLDKKPAVPAIIDNSASAVSSTLDSDNPPIQSPTVIPPSVDAVPVPAPSSEADSNLIENLILPSSEEDGPKFSFKIMSVTSLAPKKDPIAQLPPLVPISEKTPPRPAYIKPVNIRSLIDPVIAPPPTPDPPKLSPQQAILTRVDKPTLLPANRQPTIINGLNSTPTVLNTLAASLANYPTTLRCKVVPMTKEEQLNPRKCPKVLEKWLEPRILQQLFKCPQYVCAFSTDNEAFFSLHIRKEHTFTIPVPCLYCNFKTEQQYIAIHLLMRHANNNFGCPYCLYRGVCRDYIQIHQERHHPNQPTKAVMFPDLSAKIKSPALPGLTISIKPYICSCSRKFYTMELFQKHLSVGCTHNMYGRAPNRTRCGICLKNLARSEGLIKHYETHRLFEYNCRYCHFGGPTSNFILEHIAHEHPFHPVCIVTRHYKSNDAARQQLATENESVLDQLLCITQDAPPSPVPTPVPTPAPPVEAPAPAVNVSPIILAKTAPQPVTAALVPSSAVCEPPLVPDATPMEDSPPIDKAADGDDKSTDEFETLQQPASGLSGKNLFVCGSCGIRFEASGPFKTHVVSCANKGAEPVPKPYVCAHCQKQFKLFATLLDHIRVHGTARIGCALCPFKHAHQWPVRAHLKNHHKISTLILMPVDPKKSDMDFDEFIIKPKVKLIGQVARKSDAAEVNTTIDESLAARSDSPKIYFSPSEIDLLPNTPIFKYAVVCKICSYATKVKSNLNRHMSQHLMNLVGSFVPASAPVNPVPCLEKNELMFDKMTNLASSSHEGGRMGLVVSEEVDVPCYVPARERYVCGSNGCAYMCLEESGLKHHLQALHGHETGYTCVHCKKAVLFPMTKNNLLDVELIVRHYRLHDANLYKCSACEFLGSVRTQVERHCNEKHADINTAKCVKLREIIDDAGGNKDSSEILPTAPAKPFRCVMCKHRSVTELDIRLHASSKHGIDAQFKCSFCPYTSNEHKTFDDHFAQQHDGCSADVIVVYVNEEPETTIVSETIESFDTTPLWVKNKLYQKHIRGILLEEKEHVPKKAPAVQASPKSTPTKASSPIQAPVKVVTPMKVTSLVEIVPKPVLAVPLPAPKTTPNKVTPPPSKVTPPSSTNLEQSIDAVARGAGGVLPPKRQRLSKDVEVVVVPEIEFVSVSTDDAMDCDDQQDALQPETPKLDDSVIETIEVPDDDEVRTTDLDKTQINSMRPEDLMSGSFLGTFGPYGKPHEDHYLCPLCASYETMNLDFFEAHLCEELRYYKHRCTICTFEAVQKSKVLSHAKTKHPECRAAFIVEPKRGNREIDNWIEKVGLFQMRIIQHLKRLQNKQKNAALRTSTDIVTVEPEKPKPVEVTPKEVVPEPVVTTESPAPVANEEDISLLQPEVIMAEHEVSSTTTGDESLLQVLPDDGHSCPHCTYKARYKGDLTSHIRRHWAEKPYKCGHCDFKGVRRPEITAHSKSKHLGKPVEIIEIDIPTPTILPIMHRKKAPKKTGGVQNAQTAVPDCVFACAHCDEVAATFDDIQTHFLETHDGVYDLCFTRYIKGSNNMSCPFVCSDCPTSMEKYSEFREHCKSQHLVLEPSIVDAKKRYKCSQCPSASNSLPSLNAHVKLHFKPYKCMYCTYATPYPKPIKDHCLREHPDEELNFEVCDESIRRTVLLRETVLEWDPRTRTYAKRNSRQNALAAASKLDEDASNEATPAAARKLHPTARKSTSTAQNMDSYPSYYGNPPDLSADEMRDITTTVPVLDTQMTLNVTQLAKFFDLFPTVQVVDYVIEQQL